MLPLHTILHPTDFSEHSDYAFPLASSLARDHGSRLILFHVVNPPTVAYGEGIFPADQEELINEARDHLNRVRPAEGGIALERRVVEGSASQEILRAARESNASLIVMGMHGRTGLKRLLMGSVAEQIVRKAPCPVLTVTSPFLTSESQETPAYRTAAAMAAGD